MVVANRKGGSGKTTSSVNIADQLARRGKKTLVIDLDSQAQATISCGVLPHRLSLTVYELLHRVIDRSDVRETFNAAVIKHKKPFDLLPSKPDLSALEIEISGLEGRESLLKDLLLEIGADYDYVILDLPPALSLITVNGMAAAEWLVIPVEPTFLSMDGLAQMMGILYRVNAELNPELRLLGILPVKCDLRTNLARSVMTEIRQNFGDERVLPAIRNDIKLAEAPGFGMTIFEYGAGCRGAQDYKRLVDVILNRVGSKHV
jgi:chromosome partitioning protein